MKEKTFKEKFEELNNQLLDLLSNTSQEDLEKEGIQLDLQDLIPSVQSIPTIELEPQNEEDFVESLIIRLTGIKDTLIVQKSDTLQHEEVKEYCGERPFVFPSLVDGFNSDHCPYIIFFTPDGLLALLPYVGNSFSDAPPIKREKKYNF